MGCVKSRDKSLNIASPGKAIDAHFISMIQNNTEPKKIIDECIQNKFLDQTVIHDERLFIPIDKVCLNIDLNINLNRIFKTLKHFGKINPVSWLKVSFKFVEQSSVFDTVSGLLFQKLSRYNETLRHFELDFKENQAFTDQQLIKFGGQLMGKINLKSLSLDLKDCRNITNDGFKQFIKALSTSGIISLEFIRINIRGTPLTAEDGLTHLKKVYKAFSKSLKDIDITHSDNHHKNKDLFSPEASSTTHEWILSTDFTRKKIWNLRKKIQQKDKPIKVVLEKQLEKKNVEVWEITREDLEKVTKDNIYFIYSEKLQRLLNPITAVNVTVLDVKTMNILNQIRNLKLFWDIDLTKDTQKTLNTVMKTMQSSKNMKVFHFEIKDHTFSGVHLEQLGKIIEKRGDIEQVFILIKECKGISDNDLRQFLESLRKSTSSSEELMINFENNKGYVAQTIEEFLSSKERLDNPLKTFQISARDFMYNHFKQKLQNNENYQGLTEAQKKMRSMKSKIKSRQFDKKKNR